MSRCLEHEQNKIDMFQDWKLLKTASHHASVTLMKEPSFLPNMSNDVHTVLTHALSLSQRINSNGKKEKQWSCFSYCHDAKFGILYTTVIVVFVALVWWNQCACLCSLWVRLLFLQIIIKQSKMPAVVVNNGVVVLSPVSACAEELAQWPQCQAAGVVGPVVCFGTEYNMCESHQQQN